MSFRDFDAAMQSIGRPTFVLGGQKFTCRAPAKMAWAKWNNIIMDLDGGPAGSVKAEVERTKGLLKKVIIASDRQRFMDLLEYEGDDEGEDEDDVVVSNKQVGELLNWVLETYTGKGETSESTLSEPPSDAGLPVKRASLSAVPTLA